MNAKRTQELIDKVNAVAARQTEIKLEMLKLFLSHVDYLSPDYVLDAIIDKMLADKNTVDDKLAEGFQNDLDKMGVLYSMWNEDLEEAE